MNRPVSKPPRLRAIRRAQVLKLIRRIHLYAGLFLAPWVMLYGTTALLFNHPGAFTERAVSHLGADLLAGTALADPPTSKAAAEEVHAAIMTRLAADGVDTRGWSRPDNARWIGRFALRGRDGDRRIDMRVAPTGKGLTVHERPLTQALDHPLASIEALDARPADAVAEGDWSSLARALELPADALRYDGAPTLMFDLATPDGTWRMSYDLDDRELEGEPLAGRDTISTARSFLMDLHTTHAYPSVFSLRWLWSLVVDAMGVAMITWGLTGLMMWFFQLKSLRRVGLWVVGGGVLTIFGLAVSLFGSFGY